MPKPIPPRTYANPLDRAALVSDRRASDPLSEAFNALQENTEALMRDIAEFPLLGGNIVSVDLASGSNKVAHKLGKAYQGWIVVSNDTQDIYPAEDTTTTDKAQYLTLSASGACAVKLLVF